jgi:hypothetical protein
MAVGLMLIGLVAPQYHLRSAAPDPTSLAADPGPQPLLRPRPVAFSKTTTGFQSWALLNTRTRAISGSDNVADTSDTVSMVKAWLAADYLRRAAQRGEKPRATLLQELSIMIRDSDNEAGEDIYRRNGATTSIRRLISVCGLTDSAAVPDRWSETRMSARDAVRMGACLADGRAAGKQWTKWLQNEMRNVRGDGRFGVVNALPDDVAPTTAIKNGWLLRDTDALWHVNCLAVGDGWVLAIMMQYPGPLGFAHGGAECESVTTQLMDPAAAPSSASPESS